MNHLFVKPGDVLIPYSQARCIKLKLWFFFTGNSDADVECFSNPLFELIQFISIVDDRNDIFKSG
jgi:hypothetical protein